MSDDLEVVVVGGGSFGTSLAHLLAQLGRKMMLWVRRPELAAEINERHTNSRYLGDTALSASLRATTELAAARRAPVVLVAVPSRSFREVARQLGEHLGGDQVVVHATKGIEVGTFKRMSEILREETCALKIGVVSGPNLSRELIAGQPSGALVASRYEVVVRAFQTLFAGGTLRVYGGSDVVGTEVGGAFKNIIALAAGVGDGLGFGDNTKALVMTRGLSEMARFGVALGAEVMTFGGLAGIGDLMATCASPLSRNHQVGERLGKGEQLDAILGSMPYVAEGVTTTRAVHEWASARHLDLPIVAAVWRMLYGGTTAREAVVELMRIPVGTELAALRYR
jgi:glycerol-3-phosphate dehydrogenase (NAD(P)+)